MTSGFDIKGRCRFPPLPTRKLTLWYFNMTRWVGHILCRHKTLSYSLSPPAVKEALHTVTVQLSIHSSPYILVYLIMRISWLIYFIFGIKQRFILVTYVYYAERYNFPVSDSTYRQNTERNQKKNAYILMVPSAASRALLQSRAKKASQNSRSKGYHPRTISWHPKTGH